MEQLDDRLEINRIALKAAFGVVPVLAGLDKFFNLMTDWSTYLSPSIAAALPLSADTFMYVVGVIEIAAGLAVLSRWTAVASRVVAVWLIAIAANLVVAGYFDVAVRDLVLALGAWTLSTLSALSARREPVELVHEDEQQPARRAA